MSESQKRYAVEQYNLALVRRGLPFDHPVPEQPTEPNPHGPRDPLAELDFNQPLNNEERQLAAELEGSAQEHHQDNHQNSGEAAANYPDIRDFDESLFDHPSTSSAQPGPSGMKRAGASAPGEATPVKQSAGSDGARRRLVGTGGDGGQEGAPMEGGPRDVALPNPSTGIDSHIRYFRKIHRVFSYGIAYKILKQQVGTGNLAQQCLFLTTPLMEVPWDRRFYYINPSEFNLLPPGSSFNKVRIKVIQRNVRVAFPTNQTSNNLATLNQNKNIIYARGLYKKCNSIPLKYTGFEATQPMIPTGVNWPLASAPDVDYSNLALDMYGPPDNQTDFTTVVPKHQVGIPQVYPYYANLIMSDYNDTAGQNELMGWECLQKHYQELDADASAGNCIFESEYHPRVGLCKQPAKPIYRNFIGKRANGTVTEKAIYIPRTSLTFEPHINEFKLDGKQNGEVTAAREYHGTNVRAVTPFTHTGYIEQSQAVYEGLFSHEQPQTQDSLHIGVQPTFALTTAALTSGNTNSSFTDTQAYFEIIAECEINTAYPTFRPHAPNVNVKEGNQWKETNLQRSPLAGMFDGMYVYRLPST